MTRKRFVKLLMAKGYDRNWANDMAMVAQKKGYSYEKAYRMATGIQDLVDNTAQAIVNLSETVSKLATALNAGFAAFAEKYAASMKQEVKNENRLHPRNQP